MFRYAAVFSFLICVGCLVAALVGEHVLGHGPCEWCVVQRLVFVALAITLLPLFLFRVGFAVKLSITILVFALACLGLSATLMQFSEGASQSCSISAAAKLIDLLALEELSPTLFRVSARCEDASAIRFFGLPYYYWSGLMILVVLIVQLVAFFNTRQSEVSADC